MFGYINVNRKELSKEDEEIYQAYYCGLCRQLKDTAGVKGQMLLNYDMAFLILLQTGLYDLQLRDPSDGQEAGLYQRGHRLRGGHGYPSQLPQFHGRLPR